MVGEADSAWAYASLTLTLPGWPGTRAAEWVAATPAGEQYRCVDPLEAMNRLGADGWEMVAFFPEMADRPCSFYFKIRRGRSVPPAT